MRSKITLSLIFCSSLLFAAPSKPKKDPANKPEQQAFNQGYSLQKSKDYVGATEKYKEAVALNPKYAEAYNNLAFCYKMIAKSYLKLSGQNYEKALNIQPNFPEALEYQGVYFIMNGELKKAYSNYKTLLTLDNKEAIELKNELDPVMDQAKYVLSEMNR